MTVARTLVERATIVTGDDAGTIHYDAALAVEGDRIAAIGGVDALRARYPDAERVHAGGRAVFPGFANAHTHFPLTLARGIYEDYSPPHQAPWTGGLARWPLPRLSPGEREVMVRLAAVEAIRSGTTLVLEDGAGIDTYAPALLDSGVRYLLCERAWDRADANIGQPGDFKLDPALADDAIARIAALHAKWDGRADGRLRVGVAAWAPDMCSPPLLRRLRDLRETLDTIATLHLNQIWGEVAAVRELRGMLPTEYAAAEGFLSSRVVAAHCRCMTPDEERILGASGASVAFNAAIAARRGLSPRIADLEQYGCLIAMGSDNMSEDMIEVVRTGLFMERVRRQDGRRPSPEEALTWATRNGYRALGVPDGGWLTPGNKADLVVVDLRKPHLVPALRVVSDFVHQGQPSDVEAVMVDGRWLMRDNRVRTLDEPVICAEAERVARGAWKRLLAERPDLPPPPGLALEVMP